MELEELRDDGFGVVARVDGADGLGDNGGDRSHVRELRPSQGDAPVGQRAAVRMFGGDLPLHALRQLGKDKPVAHVAQVEHDPRGKVGLKVDGDPRAPVGVVAGEHGLRVLGAQLQDAVGVALEREQVAPRVGRLGVVRGGELAGELPAANSVDHPAPLLVGRLAGAGAREQAGIYAREVHGAPPLAGLMGLRPRLYRACHRTRRIHGIMRAIGIRAEGAPMPADAHQERLAELLDPSLAEGWRKLCSAIEGRYEMERAWGRAESGGTSSASTAGAARHSARSTPPRAAWASWSFSGRTSGRRSRASGASSPSPSAGHTTTLGPTATASG